MQRLKKFLFGGSGKLRDGLPDDVRAAVEAWREQPEPDLGVPHYQVRYAVVDVATSGLQVEHDKLLGIAGVGLQRAAVIAPDDAFALDLGDDAADGAIERSLAAFLHYAGQGPLVTYQAPFVGAFLRRLFEARFGLRYEPDWIDLAWLLPDLFNERIDSLVPMDAWLESFGIEVPGRRDALADSVALARLLQLALVRAIERGADTPAKLLDIGRARRWLRHNN